MADETIYSPSVEYRATMRCYMGMPGRESIVDLDDIVALPPEIGDMYPECLVPVNPPKKKKADAPAG